MHPTPYTLHPQPSTLSPQPSTLNPQPSTLNPQPPTLQANSFSESGRRIPGQTDVPACEGHPLELTLKAVDADAGDLVRIYLEDKDFYVDDAAAAADPRIALRQKLLGLNPTLSQVT